MSMSAAVNLAFPTTQEINHVVRNTVVDTSAFIGNSFCPVVNEFSNKIEVDVIHATTGITSPRAKGSPPKIRALSGNSTRMYASAGWGNTYRLDEDELLNARLEGTYNQRAGYQRVYRRAGELNTQLETRIEQLRWAPLTDGVIEVDENGVTFSVDYKIPSENMGVEYEILTNANFDVNDLFNDINKKFRGTGGKARTMYFNVDVAAAFAKNASFKDLLKQSMWAAQLSLDNIEKALKLCFPKLDFVVYDEGYKLTETGDYTMFIPDGTFVVLGGRPGEPLMDFASTLALQGNGVQNPQPGKFSAVEDKSADPKNPYVDVTVGINGLPRIHHPEWIISGRAV